MISTNPKEDRRLKIVALSFVVMILTLTGLRACHTLRSDANWHGPLSTYASLRTAMEVLP